MNSPPDTGDRPPLRHGLASELPGSGPVAARVEQLTRAFSGDGPTDERCFRLARAAAAAHYRVEQVQAMVDRLWEQAAYHSMPVDVDALMESLDLLGLSRTIHKVGEIEQLRFCLRTHRLLADEHHADFDLCARMYGLRSLLDRLERYRRRALSQRAKAFDHLVAAELASGSEHQDME